MKRKSKIIFAFLLNIIILGNYSILIFAEELGEGDVVGKGEIEGCVQEDIYKVVLPTVAEDTFDFIIDPQGLINRTNGAAYGDKRFEENSTLFFRRKDGEVQEDYSNKSDEINIINMSSVAINIAVDISISETSLDGILLTDDREFIDDNNASLYMALVDGEDEIPILEEGISFDVTVDAAPEGAYEYSYNSEKDEYTYKLKQDNNEVEFDEYSFQLTGAANRNGDWSQLIGKVPEINVTWKIVSQE